MAEYYNDFFGDFGGRYVAEILRSPLDELEKEFLKAMSGSDFKNEFNLMAREYTGRPTPLMFAENATKALGGAEIYIKLEGLANTGAHKINNVIGQCLLARQMGKKRIIAETGAGQHGVAVAAVCARLGFECRIYMGEVDIRRQRPNLFWMELYGAEVVPVKSGSKTLKDAVNEALRDWASSFSHTHYLLGSSLGPSPYPDMVREFQSVIGKEVEDDIKSRNLNVEALIACVGGGSNSIGFFYPFLENEKPRLIGVEAGGRGSAPGDHASRMGVAGKEGIVQGYKSLFLLDEEGQVQPTHSISAGLDYCGIGPQLASLGQRGRIEFTKALDREALDAVRFFAGHEGIIFALESAHAGAVAMKMAKGISKDKAIIINMSGRGDKDLFILARELDRDNWIPFLKEEVAQYAMTAQKLGALTKNIKVSDRRKSCGRPNILSCTSALRTSVVDVICDGKNRLMTHLVAYYPNRDASLRVAKALIDGGSSFLEVQFPFSDPTADGVYIQHACKQALDQGFKLTPGFELLALIKELAPHIPLFVMSYANIAYRLGIKNFLEKCKEAGAQGVIIPDLPPDYDEGLFAAGKRCNLQVIPVIAPTISNSRLKTIAETGAEYLYASLRKGITGAVTEIGKENLDFLDRIKPLGMKILAGFGIAERKQVEVLSPYVHAAVIGSAFIKEIMNTGEEKDPYKVILAKMKSLIPLS